MERRRIKLGQQVGVRPASRRSSYPVRAATVRGVIHRPGRNSRAVVVLEDGDVAELPLWRLVS